MRLEKTNTEGRYLGNIHMNETSENLLELSTVQTRIHEPEDSKPNITHAAHNDQHRKQY